MLGVDMEMGGRWPQDRSNRAVIAVGQPRAEARLRRELGRRGLSPEAVEDVLQETRLRASRTAAQFGTPTSFVRWFVVVGHTAAARVIAADERFERAKSVAGPGEGRDAADAALASLAIREAIGGLTPTQRSSLAYPFHPAATTKAEQDLAAVRLKRARAALDARLKDLMAPVAALLWRPLNAIWRRVQALRTDPAPVVVAVTALVTGATIGSFNIGAADTYPAAPRFHRGLPGRAIPARPTGEAGRVQAARGPGRTSTPASAPAAIDRRPAGAGLTLPLGTQARFGQAAPGAEASVQNTRSVGVGPGGSALRLTVHCDTEVRRRVCAALPAGGAP
jgi:hypothetical protein